MADGIAIIGNMDSFMGFAALGVEVRDPSKEDTAPEEILASLSPNEYIIIFVSEKHAAGMFEEISKRNRSTSQSVIMIPEGRESKGFAGERIRNLVRRAVGADII